MGLVDLKQFSKIPMELHLEKPPTDELDVFYNCFRDKQPFVVVTSLEQVRYYDCYRDSPFSLVVVRGAVINSELFNMKRFIDSTEFFLKIGKKILHLDGIITDWACMDFHDAPETAEYTIRMNVTNYKEM